MLRACIHACMQASKLPPALDRAWEAVGGGPADLFFPEDFLGLWAVESVLTSVKLPLGPDFVPDPKVPPTIRQGCMLRLCSRFFALCMRMLRAGIKPDSHWEAGKLHLSQILQDT